jgi:hypothetical protein
MLCHMLEDKRDIGSFAKANNTLLGHFIILLILTTFTSCNSHPTRDKSGNQIKTAKRMNFRASFCNPFEKDIIELGSISKDSVLDKFENTAWGDILRQMSSLKEEEIYYSPSLEIENKDNKHGLAISAVGDPDSFEFYIFYKRPKRVKTFFGLREKTNENFTTEKTGQTKQDVIDCLDALLKNDTEYLANKIGQ